MNQSTPSPEAHSYTIAHPNAIGHLAVAREMAYAAKEVYEEHEMRLKALEDAKKMLTTTNISAGELANVVTDHTVLSYADKLARDGDLAGLSEKPGEYNEVTRFANKYSPVWSKFPAEGALVKVLQDIRVEVPDEYADKIKLPNISDYNKEDEDPDYENALATYKSQLELPEVIAARKKQELARADQLLTETEAIDIHAKANEASESINIDPHIMNYYPYEMYDSEYHGTVTDEYKRTYLNRFGLSGQNLDTARQNQVLFDKIIESPALDQ